MTAREYVIHPEMQSHMLDILNKELVIIQEDYFVGQGNMCSSLSQILGERGRSKL